MSHESEQLRLKPIIERLAMGYQQNGDWKWLEENRGEQWWALIRE